jgi:excisionase family DNA binding protein
MFTIAETAVPAQGGAGRPRLITAKTVAEQLAVPVPTIYQLAREGRIPGVVRVGRLVRFDPERVEAWIEAGGQALPGGWRKEPAEGAGRL